MKQKDLDTYIEILFKDINTESRKLSIFTSVQ